MTAIIFGSVAFDTIFIPDAAPRKDILGGSAAYASIAASFFTKAQLVSVVGSDWNEEFSARLEARGVDLRGLEKRSDEKTFSWVGRYLANKDEREGTVNIGVFTPDYAPVVPDEYKGTPIVFLSAASPKSSMILLDQLDAPKLVVADTIENYIEKNRDDLLKLLRRIDGFTLNESEATKLTGEEDPHKAALKILELGPNFVIVKLGSSGAIWVPREGESERYPIYPTKAVDTTGAGDSFGGAFIGTLAEFNGDLSPDVVRLACLRATAVASLNIEDYEPARLERATRDEIDARVEELERLREAQCSRA